MKTRILSQNNYKAVYFDGKTLRSRIDRSKDITELEYPEFYDVKITEKCFGNCEYCYQDSQEKGRHAENAVYKIYQIFSDMSANEKPFQVALGGGEPTLHPQFEEILKTFTHLDITPNYTTNGMFMIDPLCLWERTLELTKQYVGGVAVTAHKHLEGIWNAAVNCLLLNEINTNIHFLISDWQSIYDFWQFYRKYENLVSYFVLLPYTEMGRAKPKEVLANEILDQVERYGSPDNIAFGANFVKYLEKHSIGKKYSIYDPEAMSGYIDLVNMTVHKSSFNLKRKEVPINV